MLSFKTTTSDHAALTHVSLSHTEAYGMVAEVLDVCLVQEWADGISLSCKLSTVQNNVVTGATDGGIVIFGSPGSWIHNNTIINQGAMQLGGINMVDYLPWSGNFTGTIVENNNIMGGFATNLTNSTSEEGKNTYDAFIKYVNAFLSALV